MGQKLRTLLIIEDDTVLQKQLRWALDDFQTIVAQDEASAVAQLRRHEPAVMTLDLGLPPMPDTAETGLRLLSEILSLQPHSKIIILSGQHDRDNALQAVARGAYDFLDKPVETDVLRLTVERAFRLHELQMENSRLRQMQNSSLEGFLTHDKSMLKVCRMIERVASANATVALLGESGTGKEILARAVHRLSGRADHRFVAINCAAIPENLLESELFGYEKGAFTGAERRTPGKIESAHQGTLFLDEIGDLPFPLQAKLLRFLQERVIERIGGREEIPVDVRIVCATHRDLKQLTDEGKFREDLYYRLAEIVVPIPPLRERVGDAVLLAHNFVQRFSRENGRAVAQLSPEAINAIESHAWPGNVRELENCLKRATIMVDGAQILAEDLGLDQPNEPLETLNLRAVRERAERTAVIRVLGRTNYNIARAAEILGISRPSLYDLMNRFELKKES